MQRAAAADATLKLSLAVVVECWETPRHVMKLDKAPIAEARDTLERALAVYARRGRVDFVDVYRAQAVLAKGPPHVATFNVPGLTARRPEAR